MLKGSLEDNVLTMLAHSTEHAAMLTITVTSDLFSTRAYRKIAEKTITFIQTYNEPPGVHLRDILEDDLRRGEDGRLLARVLDDMDNLAPDLRPDYVLSELSQFIAKRKLANAIEEASDALASGDLEGAERALYQRDYAVSASPGIWLHDPEAMLAFLNQPEGDFFSSGIELLDRRNIRPQRKTMFLMIGAKKVGKSWWLIEVGKQGIMHGKSVLHITLENSEELTAQRYVQAFFAYTTGAAQTVRVPIFKKDALGRFTSMDYDNRVPISITQETRSHVAQRLSALRTRPRLLIKEFPTSSLSIPQLNAYLDSLSRSQNFRPDLLIVDYPDLMQIRSDNVRTDTSQIFKQLRGVAVSRNIAVVAVTQANRIGDGSRTVSSGHVAEDFSKTQTADIVCTISRTPAEREIGTARILVDAARNADDKWVAVITQNYPTGQFCLDSVYMSKHIEEAVNQFAGEDQDE